MKHRAATDADGLAGDAFGSIGGQKHRQGSDFLHFKYPVLKTLGFRGSMSPIRWHSGSILK